MIPRAFLQLLQRQPVETSRIENVHRRPAVATITHIGGYALLASEFNGISDEPLLDGVVNLGKAHHPHAQALCRERSRRQLRGHARNRVGAIRRILLCRRAARCTVRNARPGRDEQRPVGAGQRRAQGLDGVSVYLTNFLELRKVVNEGRVDHTVRHGRALAQAFEVIKIAAMYLGARGRKRLGAGIRARQAQHLMARVNEFWNDGGTDKAGGAGNKNTHIHFSFWPVQVARIYANDLDWP